MISGSKDNTLNYNISTGFSSLYHIFNVANTHTKYYNLNQRKVLNNKKTHHNQKYIHQNPTNKLYKKKLYIIYDHLMMEETTEKNKEIFFDNNKIMKIIGQFCLFLLIVLFFQ